MKSFSLLFILLAGLISGAASVIEKYTASGLRWKYSPPGLPPPAWYMEPVHE